MSSSLKKITLVVDPLPSGFSVQMTFLKSVISLLDNRFLVSVYSNYFSPSKKKELLELGLSVKEKEGRVFSRSLKKILFPHLNESLLWSVNWIFDALEIIKLKVSDENVFAGSDYVIDLSSTVMPKSDVWWIQGPPFFEVLETMSKSNKIIRTILKLFSKQLKKASTNIINEKVRRSRQLVANSKYISSIYKAYGINIANVVHSSQNFEFFKPCGTDHNDNFVLTYIGKETDVDTLVSLARSGINLVGFGSKIPPGMGMQKIKKYIRFLGRVSNDELVRLYSSAKFFAFPFTNEPFGYTPIESMLCGAPVLTYNKEGPSETVINGETGWLVNTKEEFIQKAYQLWNSTDSGIDPRKCIQRGSELKLKYELDKLIKIMVAVAS